MRLKPILFVGAAVVGVQLALLGGFALGQLRPQLPGIVAFDPERSLTLFVIWSSDRVQEGAFEEAVVVFERRTRSALANYSATTGAMVVRRDAVLSEVETPLTDITEDIMREVLDDEAF
ncbi:hypothetical protein [Shimia sp. FJ5]|uniref:hypothetical protein n=1 Tax=Shimia sp. FJ5 TaxID=3079054 RepID=UPI00293DA56A|nr:hypothetical protein [Shimia sp. FJ5]MDV4146443.1 hypothetical protein [Shimia sp. FJ5]